MIILGIDPGLADTGYGVIRKEKNNLSFIAHGCIQTDKKNTFPKRLGIISLELNKIIKKDLKIKKI